jgi:iron complex outermembrane recepter protein
MLAHPPLRTALALAVGAALLSQAAAQDVQRVEITGSNIRRVQSETASPVQTLTREEIARSGKSSIAELLQTLSVDNQGSVPTSFGAGFASGASGISLRGLGAASTLVLINGRRIAPYGNADDGQKVFADLNVIPLEAVERVEILKDGGSAIYGSDAIAGVVNIILRKDFSGLVGKATIGQSRYRDGDSATAALTGGWGNLANDKFNVLVNLEATTKKVIWARDRAGRGAVGRADLRDLGFSAQEALGGTGAITGNNAGGSSVNGNVRNPTTLDYYSRGNLAGVGFTRTFPGAACGNFTSHPQGDPGGGCLTDAPQDYGQILPPQDTLNLFTRGTLELSPTSQIYAELNAYHAKSTAATTPSTVSGSVGYPGGPVSNAGVSLGAAHPDNPYFGTAARLRYLATDVGPRINHVKSDFTRFLLGAKTTVAEWELDSGLLVSQTKNDGRRTGFLQRDVAFALLNPTPANVAAATAGSAAYAALPAGSVWRIAENANLNAAAVYAALSPDITGAAKSKTTQLDLHATRELAQWDGGALTLALGAEVRRETLRLDPVTGTERGNIIGLGYSAYNGSRTLGAAYAELLMPITKTFEANLAARVDHYSDVGNSSTPKLGLKWTPLKELALRSSFSRGFRAPSPAENGKGGLAAFTTAADPLRCALGVAAACNPAAVAVITSPNPDLTPEKSSTVTAGLVFDPSSNTSLAVDLWRVKRKDEINQTTTAEAIAAGRVVRDPGSATTIPGDPGAIVAVLANYVNSASSTVTGFDVDARQAFPMGSAGKLGLDVKWTHISSFKRSDRDGTSLDFAGTHGNCDVTNCIGTPADRVNFGVSWELGDWRVAALANYRAAMKNRLSKDDPDCASTFADGSDAPAGCKIKAFTTVDLTARWKVTSSLEVFGNIQNLFDTKPPLDPLTYGAVSYNPLDSAGAIGRFFNVGVRYRFF